MLIISHRGNLNGPNKDNENKPQIIEEALLKGFDVEVDLWKKNSSFFLGHNKPEIKIHLDWLLSKEKSLWVHCKNLEAISYLSKNDINLNYFFHQSDDLTLTSRNFIWVYPKKDYSDNSVIVCKSDNEFKSLLKKTPYGICTDNPFLLKSFI